MSTYSTYTDAQLVVKLNAGDAAAFEEIFMRYNSLLYLYAYRKLQSHEEAKDIVQEVFITLWDSRETFALKTYLAAFLYKSVLNKVLNNFKHQTIHRQYADVQLSMPDLDPSGTDFLIRKKELQQLIDAEVAAMPARMREIYELKKKHYLSSKEIAAQLNISEMTVSTQLKRAMKRLRSQFGLIIYLLYIMR